MLSILLWTAYHVKTKTKTKPKTKTTDSSTRSFLYIIVLGEIGLISELIGMK